MKILISGKILSFIVYKLCLEFFIVKKMHSLTILQCSVGWFLIEHIFEEYKTTAGKLFLINEDFRTVITNSVLIINNLILNIYNIGFLTIFLCLVTIFWLNKIKVNCFITYQTVKIRLNLFWVLIILTNVFCLIVYTINLNENFIQEFLITNLIIYFYLYIYIYNLS